MRQHCNYCGELKELIQSDRRRIIACAECLAPQEPHSCPYAADINNDSEFQCTCSMAETRECAEDI